MSSDLQILVQRAQNGDREALGTIYEQLAPRIYGYVYLRVNGVSEVAEDITSGVFVRIIEKMHLYQDRGLPFSAWVFRLAHNQVVDHFRSHPSSRQCAIADDSIPERSAEHALGTALTMAELTTALASLTADQRYVVVARFLDGLSIAETAALVAKTDDAVKKLQARGLQALRRALTSNGTTPENVAA